MPVSFNLISFEPRFGGQHLSFSWSSGEAGPTSEPAMAGAAELPLPFHDLSPRPHSISLLSWHTELSDFRGRDREIGELKKWAEGPEKISAKVLTGTGGSGKSRLAAEFGREMREQDWSAGFVNLAQPSGYRVSSEGGLFLIDYPEEAHRQVVEFLGWLARSEYPAKIRVLLVTRQPLMFWQQSFHAAKCEDVIDYQEVRLDNITTDELYRIYNSAVEKASIRLETIPLPLSLDGFTAWVAGVPENRLPLFVVAAAAHAALRPDDPVIHYSGREIVAALVVRELHRLEPISEATGLAGETLARVLSLAVLAGGLDGGALPRLTGLGGLGLATVEDPVGRLRSAGLLSDGAVEPLKPDIVGAAFTARALAEAGDVAAEWVWFGLQNDRDFAAACVRLARLIHDERLISGQPGSVIEQRLLDGIKGKTDRLLSLASFLQDPETPYSLAGIEQAVWEGLIEAAPNGAAKALAANNLAFCLLNQHEYDRAIALLRDAVAAHDRISAAFGNGAEYERGLALMNLGRASAETGQFKPAIKELRAAVRCFRHDAARGDAKARSSLSGALDVLGQALHKEGESGGLRLLVEAARLTKELADSNPAAYAGDYVWRLINLGAVRLSMGNPRGALESFNDGIAVARSIVEAPPGRHEDKLGKSLINKALVLAKLRDFDGAFDTMSEAVALYRALNDTTGGLFRLEQSVCLLNWVNLATAAAAPEIVIEASLALLEDMRSYAAAAPAEQTAGIENYAAHALAKAFFDLQGPESGLREFLEKASATALRGQEAGLREIFSFASRFDYYPAPLGDWRAAPPKKAPGITDNVEVTDLASIWQRAAAAPGA